MWDPSALADDDHRRKSCARPNSRAATRAIAEMYPRPARPMPNKTARTYADPISCPGACGRRGGPNLGGRRIPTGSRQGRPRRPPASSIPASGHNIAPRESDRPWPRPTSTSSQAAQPRGFSYVTCGGLGGYLRAWIFSSTIVEKVRGDDRRRGSHRRHRRRADRFSAGAVIGLTRQEADVYRRLRERLGRTILLGLELLVAGDIISHRLPPNPRLQASRSSARSCSSAHS